VSKAKVHSNTISQRVMKPLKVDVYSAACERLRYVFSTYDKVVVSYSGGKDSTVCLELAIEVARELDKLPVDVLFFDEEVLLPETEEMVRRTRGRPEVNLTWVCGQVGYWDASSNEEPHWITWDPAKKEVWVREPPKFATCLGQMKYPAPGDAIARLWEPEHGKVAEVLGLRGYESRPRMYGLISSGSYIARGPAPHVDKVRPIFDWRGRDVWLAIHRFGWDYNQAYDRMYRLGRSAKELRIAVPTSIEAMNHWDDWMVLHPQWWSKVRRRFPNIHSLALFNHDLHRPVRKEGETWQQATYRYLEANLVEDQAKIERDIEKVLRAHGFHSTVPMREDKPCTLCRFSWRKLARIAMFGNPGNRLNIK
jgi:predicted phosphoadenosine phosphosulfate sulfurtransferase